MANVFVAEAKNEKFMRGDMVEDGIAEDDGFTGDDDVTAVGDEQEGIPLR